MYNSYTSDHLRKPFINIYNKTVPFRSKNDQNIISLYIVTINEELRDNENLKPGHREEIRVKYSTSQRNPFLFKT